MNLLAKIIGRWWFTKGSIIGSSGLLGFIALKMAGNKCVTALDADQIWIVKLWEQNK